LGRFDEALAIYEKGRTVRPDDGGFQAGIARLYALIGKRREAQQMISNSKAGPFKVEVAYAALGDKDEAFRILERSKNELSARFHQGGSLP
jgi:tetratricopeptide (TPR) repeat protein